MRIALALPHDAQKRLRASAEYHGHEIVLAHQNGDHLATALPGLDIDRIIVQATNEQLSETLIHTADTLGIRMLVIAGDDKEHQHAEDSGILDAASGPVEWHLLGEALGATSPTKLDATEATPSSTNKTHPGTTITVWGSYGSPGRTSLAINLAAELTLTGQRVTLIDADTHAASIALSLALPDNSPGFGAACRLTGLAALDSRQFEQLALVHRLGKQSFRVLTGLTPSERWVELSTGRVSETLAVLRSFSSITVVDTAASLGQAASGINNTSRNTATQESLRAADRVVAIVADDQVGMTRFLRSYPELLNYTEPEKITVVVNKIRTNTIGIHSKTQPQRKLNRLRNIRADSFIPWDSQNFASALTKQKTLAQVSPRSPARRAIQKLAAELFQQ